MTNLISRLGRSGLAGVCAVWLLAACGDTVAPGYTDLSPDGFEEKIGRPDTVLLDVRTPSEFAADRIPGAVNVDFLSADFESNLRALDSGKTYLVYCRSGNRSVKAIVRMKRLGFERLFHLEGGIQAWKAAAKRTERPPEGRIAP